MLFSVEEYNPNLHNKQGFVWLDILNYYTFMVKKKKVAINLHIKDKQGSDKKKMHPVTTFGKKNLSISEVYGP